MDPVYIFQDIIGPAGLTPRDVATGALAFSAVLLAFLYFALAWATNRMKDFEARRDGDFEAGSPAMVCWTSAAGSTSIAILATQFFFPLYLVLNDAVYWWHLFPLLAMLVVIAYFWVCLLRLFQLHFRNDGNLHPLSHDMLRGIHDYRRGFRLMICCILTVGWSAFVETLFGSTLAGLMAMAFFLLSIASLGSYISLSSDLFPRSVSSSGERNA